MSGTVFTVASGKGGVGKTTTSVNLAVALWQEGKAVALVDADIGMANLAAVLDLEPEATLHDVLAGRATVDEAAVEAQGGNLLVLPGDRSLESFADADPGRLRAAVTALAERCDYVIVDTGAGLSYEDVLPLGMADGVVLVTTPDPAAFGDTRKTMEVADLLGAPVRGLVVTRAVEDTDAEAIAGEIGAELLGTIPEDPAVMASTVAGNPLESHAPKSDAAAAYRDLAATVLAGDSEWLETHAGGREVDAADGPATGDDTDDPSDSVPDERAGGEPDEGAADDAGSNTAAGEAWAAANESPPDDGAAGGTHIGDLMTEVGEADGAGDADVRPGQPASDRTDADAPGPDGEGRTAESETPGPDDEPEPERATDPDDETIDADRASSTDEPVDQEATAEADVDADDAGDGAGDAAFDDGEVDVDGDAGADGDADDAEELEEPDDPAEADDSAGATDEGEARGPEGAEELDDTAEEAEEAGEAGDAGDGEESAESEEAPEPEASEEEGESEDAQDSGEEGESEDENGEAEKRGGFFGWLGRLFG